MKIIVTLPWVFSWVEMWWLRRLQHTSHSNHPLWSIMFCMEATAPISPLTSFVFSFNSSLVCKLRVCFGQQQPAFIKQTGYIIVKWPLCQFATGILFYSEEDVWKLDIKISTVVCLWRVSSDGHSMMYNSSADFNYSAVCISSFLAGQPPRYHEAFPKWDIILTPC